MEIGEQKETLHTIQLLNISSHNYCSLSSLIAIVSDLPFLSSILYTMAEVNTLDNIILLQLV